MATLGRWARRLLLLAGLGVVGLFGSVLGVGLYLSSPRPMTVGPPPAMLAGAEPVVIASASGSRLHGWFVPGVAGGGAVVLMHGVRASRLVMVERARVLRAHGFAVLLFDFRAHGESPGGRITFGGLEALDAAAAVGFVRGRLPEERVGAVGVSLGGAAALLGPERLPVDALVLESVYPTIDAGLGNRLRTALGPGLGTVFTPVLTPVFDVLMAPVLGVDPAALRPIDGVGRIGAPLLLASGTVDTSTPLTEAAALFARAAEPKRFWPVPGAGHVDLERFDPEGYWDHVLPFLTQALQQGAPGLR